MNAEQSTRYINLFFERNTEGRLPQILSQVPSPSTNLLLLNAIYFRGTLDMNMAQVEEGRFVGRSDPFVMLEARKARVRIVDLCQVWTQSVKGKSFEAIHNSPHYTKKLNTKHTILGKYTGKSQGEQSGISQIACTFAASVIFSGYYLVMTNLTPQVCSETPAKLHSLIVTIPLTNQVYRIIDMTHLRP
ncbi:hypothetical protein AVEN_236255-1 [Araneus ventricosus]|uniref:Serpin domain-containing protein n=1 Tax=Araneus ventricosus TaxID=182803 RepID=A0A4Y2NAK8_ARAVE|nr:hypothetical protein AVEN_236255-1 [Araneus ventricosus]